MKSKLYSSVMVCVLAGVLAGCEWEAGEDSGSWDDSYSWVNFSGLYRGIDGAIVGEFKSISSSSGSTGTDTTDPGIPTSEDPTDDAPAGQTLITGDLNNATPIIAGSLTLTLEATVAGGSSGLFRDAGNGTLTGYINLAGVDAPLSASGTLDYNSGAWTLNLPSPGLLTTADIKATYSISSTASTIITGTDEFTPAGGKVSTINVQQTGNVLTFTDSNGNRYDGQFTGVSTSSGDSSGLISGQVTASFEVNGSVGGTAVKISGTFSGAYTAPGATSDGASGAGQLTDRTIDGIWIQADGTADVNGQTASVTVTLNAIENQALLGEPTTTTE